MKTGQYINYQQFFSVFLLVPESQKRADAFPSWSPYSLFDIPIDTAFKQVGNFSENRSFSFSLYFFTAELATVFFFFPN